METTQMKPFKVAATFGRFNLLHNGHIHLFLQMFEQAEEVYIGLSTGAEQSRRPGSKSRHRESSG